MFTSQYELLLLQSVRKQNGRTVQHGKIDKTFAQVRDTFISKLSQYLWEHHKNDCENSTGKIEAPRG